jgi:hypothetical protein
MRELRHRLEHTLGNARPQTSAVGVARLGAKVNATAIGANAWQP